MPPPAQGESVLAASEKGMIVKTLRECDWNQTKAVRALCITRDNIRYRIRKYDIQPPQ
jgi:DNA-binding protein Fis